MRPQEKTSQSSVTINDATTTTQTPPYQLILKHSSQHNGYVRPFDKMIFFIYNRQSDSIVFVH